MYLISQFSAHFWLLFSLAVSIAVIRELRRNRPEPSWRTIRRKK
jgi:hypothetical protein